MDLLGKILSGAAGLVGKKTKALASGVGNTAGLAKDLYDYNTAKDPRKKQEELISYNNRFNAVNEAMKQFGFDSNKQGNQFDPVQYAKGITGGAGEVTSMISPMGGGMKARAAVNAVPGFTNAISEGKGIGGIATDTALSSVLGMGGEGLVKGGGKLLQGLGNKTIDTAENLGLRRFGLRKNDVNKLNQELGFPVQDFLKKNDLIGKSADDLGESIRPLQQSFDDIANSSNLKLDKKEIAQKFKGKIKEFSQANAPELQRKGAALNDYFMNLKKDIKKGVNASKLTNERKIIDSLVKDFSTSGDAINASTNRVIRDLLQDTVREGADKAGLKGIGGKSLQEIGNDLSQLYKFQDIASKRAPQPTGLPSGLLKTIAGQGGANLGVATLGGLPGMLLGGLGGIAVESIYNNPKLMQQAALKGVPLGKKMIEKGGKLVSNNILQQAMGAIGRRSGVAIGDALSGTPVGPNSNNEQNQDQSYASPNIQSSNNNLQQPIVPQDMERQQASQIAEMADPNMEIELVGPDGQPTGQKVKYSELQGQLSQGQMQGGQQAMQDDPYMQTQAKIENAMTQALQAGDIKAFTEFAGINENLMNILEKKQKLQPQGEDIDTKLKQLEYQTKMRDFNSPAGKSKALPQTAVQELSDFDNSVGLLDNLSKIIESKKDKLGPVMGRINAGNVYDTDAQSVQSELGIAAQVIGKALEGGKLAEGDIARYRKLLPNLSDTPAVAQAKIASLKQKIQNQKGARLQSYSQAGFNDKGLVDNTDMLAQILAAGQV